MRRASRAIAATVVLLSLAFAGCAGGGGGKGGADEEDPTQDLGLEATETTGVIRGIVVDEAIRPVAGVQVSILAAARNTTTNEDGAFGFDGLEQGTYFLQASKRGFSAIQQSADVVAGEAEPPLVKIQLVTDPQQVAYATHVVWEGFIRCAAKAGADGVAFGGGHVCGEEAGSRYITTFPFDEGRFPTYSQTEMRWDNTQPAGDTLELTYYRALTTDWKRADGTSPVVLNATADEIHAEEDERGEDMAALTIRVFPGSVTPASATLNQAVVVYQSYFYGFTPRADWTFIDDGPCTPAETCMP